MTNTTQESQTPLGSPSPTPSRARELQGPSLPPLPVKHRLLLYPIFCFIFFLISAYIFISTLLETGFVLRELKPSIFGLVFWGFLILVCLWNNTRVSFTLTKEGVLVGKKLVPWSSIDDFVIEPSVVLSSNVWDWLTDVYFVHKPNYTPQKLSFGKFRTEVVYSSETLSVESTKGKKPPPQYCTVFHLFTKPNMNNTALSRKIEEYFKASRAP